MTRKDERADDRSDELLSGFTVGDWSVDPLGNRVVRGDKETPLEPKVMEVLVFLARRAGTTVTKEEFFDIVWGGTVVTDDVLSRCVSELRKAFGDSSRDPRYIETIRKTGYRLIAEVALAPDPSIRSEVSDTQPRPSAGTSTSSSLPLVRILAFAVVPAIVLLAIGAYLIHLLGFTPDQESTRIARPFTSVRGLELDPAFAPDGKRMAFASNQKAGAQFDIFLKQDRSDAVLQLTDTGADERHPVWSSDGLFVAFSRRGDSTGVFVAPSLGGAERLVAAFGARAISGLSWSPVENRLAVAVEIRRFEASAIFLVSVDSGSTTKLTDPPRYTRGDVSPVFSPDGRQIAFARTLSPGIQDIFVIDLQDREPRQVTFDSLAVNGLSWMPGGDAIVFSSDRDPAGSLWQVEVGSGQTRLIESAAPGGRLESPALSADGDRLSYVHRTANSNIWRVYRPSRNAAFRTRPSVFSTHFDSHPDISPDGSRIVFTSGQTGRNEIWAADPDGANPSKLTAMDGDASHPRWSPDGATVAFQLRKSGPADIYTISPVGGPPQRLVATRGDDVLPMWSRDGGRVYFSTNKDGRPEIWRVSVTSKELERVTSSGGLFGMEAVGGQAFYYTRPDTTGVWWIDEPGSSSAPIQALGSLDDQDWGNWVVASNGIYYVDRKSYVPSLVFDFFDIERTTQVIRLGNVPAHPALTASRDFDWFAYAQVDDEGADIMIMESLNP